MKLSIALIHILAFVPLSVSGQSDNNPSKIRFRGGAKPFINEEDMKAVALKHNRDKFSSSVEEFAKKWGELDKSPIEIETFYQEMVEFKSAVTMDPASVSSATFDEKVAIVQEFRRTFAVVERLLSVMQTSNSTMFFPFIEDMKQQMVTAESMTDDVLELLGGFMGNDVEEADGANSAQLVHTWKPTHTTKRRQLKNDGSFAKSHHEDFTEGDSSSSSTADEKHWHGFKDHRQYRSWRSEHTKTFPHMKHIFRALEDMHTGNHDELRERVLRKNDHHHEQLHSRGRRLSTRSKRSQCELLINCARDMSLYDLVFYHFSDYIDTNNGKFADNFRIPHGFDIMQVEAEIQTMVKKADEEKDATKKVGYCSDLLDFFHQNEATKDPDYWNWKAGAVSEVCYASGTTKKIDLYLIRKHIGVQPALKIMEQTLLAAKKLHEIRDKVNHEGEPFVYQKPDGTVRYPNKVAGLDKDGAGRPDLNVNVESFYEYGEIDVDKISKIHIRFGEDDDSKHRADLLLNSTYRVFGATSAGQIAALAETGKDDVKLFDAYCPWGWNLTKEEFDPSDDVNGIKCERGWSPVCGEDCARKQCKDTSGRWIKDVDPSVNFDTSSYACFYGKGCPRGWKGVFTSEEGGLVCKRWLSEDCNGDCAKKQCSDQGGSYAGIPTEQFEAFGGNTSVAINAKGTIRVVGSGSGNRGVVHVYREEKSTIRVECTGSVCSPNFGKSVALSADGTTLAVAQVGYMKNDGFIYMYRIDGDNVQDIGTLNKDDEDGSSYRSSFGSSLALNHDGSLLVVGQPQFKGFGCVHIMNRTSWEDFHYYADLQRFDGHGSSKAMLGASVGMSNDGKSIVVGAPRYHSGARNPHSGTVYVLAQDKPNHWKRQHQIDGASYSAFGSAVAISANGNAFVAGAPEWDNGDMHFAGGVQVYKRKQPTDQFVHYKDWNFGYAEHQFGSAVAMSPNGNRVAAGTTVAGGGGQGLTLVKDLDHWDTEVQVYGPKNNLKCGSALALSDTTKWIMGCEGEHSAYLRAGDFTDPVEVPCTMSDSYQIIRKPSLPGFCCLDSPDVSGVWGEPYTCKSTCENYAPSLAGISQGTCDIYGGKWCPHAQDCSPLKMCVERYLKAAQALKKTKDYNPTFVNYLMDAPNVTDPMDSYQCGKTREYFGYEPTFPIDMKICDEIEEYKNSQDLNFMNDVFNSMAPASDQKALGSGDNDASTLVDSNNKFKKFKTAGKKALEAAETPDNECNADALTSWQSIKFGFLLALDITQDIYDAASSLECPGDITGIVQTTCAVAKNISLIAFMIARNVARGVLELTNQLLDATVCGELDPQSQAEQFEAMKALTVNLANVYDALAERQAQTHDGLNALGVMMNHFVDNFAKVDGQLKKINGAIEGMNKKNRRNLAALTENASSSSTSFAGVDDKTDDETATATSEEPFELLINDDDMATMKEEMKAEIATLKEELMAAMRDEMKEETTAMKEALKQEVVGMMKTEMKQEMAGMMKTEMSRVEDLMKQVLVAVSSSSSSS